MTSFKFFSASAMLPARCFARPWFRIFAVSLAFLAVVVPGEPGSELELQAPRPKARARATTAERATARRLIEVRTGGSFIVFEPLIVRRARCAFDRRTRAESDDCTYGFAPLVPGGERLLRAQRPIE